MNADRPLRVRRIEAGWTQGQLGAAVGLSARKISDIERGECAVEEPLARRIDEAIRERMSEAAWLSRLDESRDT